MRVIRKIAQVDVRLRAIEAEIEALKESELYELLSTVDGAETNGRDLLAEMAAQVETQIASAKVRLERICTQSDF